MLIFVFDPLAVALVIATNKLIQLEGETENKETIKKTEPEVEPIKAEEIKLEESHEELEPEPETVLDEPEHVVAVEPEPEPELNESTMENEEVVIEPEVTEVLKKSEPVIPTGSVKLEDIKEIKEQNKRGFSKVIPKPSSNAIQRIGTNKFVKDNEANKVYFKRK